MPYPMTEMNKYIKLGKAQARAEEDLYVKDFPLQAIDFFSE